MEYKTHFVKNNDFRTIEGSGVFGGIKPSGKINIRETHFYFWETWWIGIISMSEICKQLNIPTHLHRNGRPEDPDFVSEGIYRRFKASWNRQDCLKNWAVSASIFQVNADSCVREKYSGGPEDVLYNTRPQDGGIHYLDGGPKANFKFSKSF